MAGRSNGTPPAQAGGSPLNAPNTFCLFCCQLFKSGKQEQIMPAVTWVPITIPQTGLWVTVPTCINHLEAPSTSPLIH